MAAHGEWGLLWGLVLKNWPATQEMQVGSLGWEDPLEGGMATHASILVCKNPPDREAWWATVHGVTKSWTGLSDLVGEGNGTPLQYSCLENTTDRGAW